MPRAKRAWASWNYRVHSGVATTHYWMNALQNVSQKKDYFVSINGESLVAPSAILYQTLYDHPVYTLDAMRAQADLPSLNTRSPHQRLFFCGSYFRHGFHEDAYASAVQLAETLRPHLRA
jgi:predicted NAD/FAD-binding protein